VVRTGGLQEERAGDLAIDRLFPLYGFLSLDKSPTGFNHVNNILDTKIKVGNEA
jgi:hypothetical protein